MISELMIQTNILYNIIGHAMISDKHLSRPGTYTGGTKWIKKDHHYKAPQSQQRLSFSRVSKATRVRPLG